MNREIDFEEMFHAKDKKEWRKERKRLQTGDRSKYKKTDVTKKGVTSINPSWEKGKVIEIAKEGVWLDVDGEKVLASLKGVLKKEVTQEKNIIAVGDNVRITKDLGVAYIDERESFLARTDITGKKKQLIAVNIDHLIITASIDSPPLKPALIDRYLIAAKKGNLNPLIVINKIDLLEKASQKQKDLYHQFLSTYEQLGYPILSISTKKRIGIDALHSFMKGKTVVFSGQSGVGKSSLLNATYGLNLKIGELAQKTSKGSHTTTVAKLIVLPDGGYCVDTPGIRSFGVWKLSKEEVIEHFHDFTRFPCRFPNCMHLKEPGCKVIKALEEEKISPLRYETYLNLLNEATGKKDNRKKIKE